MTESYRVFGSEMSPYSVKVRSYLRFKGLPHQWIPRGPGNEAEYRALARLPIIPLVVGADGEAMQDSTPVMERLEARHPDPAAEPADPDLRFLSQLLEEFGDEWGNKLMFHHRWYDEVDQRSAALILARLSLPDGNADEVSQRAVMVRERMTGRGAFVGSSPQTAPLISKALFELLDILDPHLKARPYLFGGRPSFADFGLASQLYEASIDPTCSGIIRARGLSVLDWCHRVLQPRVEGEHESWQTLEPTLAPLLAYVGAWFLPWTVANAHALSEGAAEFTVELPAGAYVQPPQKYHARSLAELRSKYANARTPALDAWLDSADCRRWLA